MKSQAFKRRRKAAPEAPETPVTPPVPMSEPSAAGNPFAALQPESLAAVIKALSGAKELMNDKAAVELIGKATEELAKRPPVVENAPAAVSSTPSATPPAGPLGSGATASRRRRRASGLEEAAEAHAKVDDNTHIEVPPTEDIEKFAGKSKLLRRANSGFFVQDLDVEQGSTAEVPEIAEARSKKDDRTGIVRPTTEPIEKFAYKYAADLTTSTALRKSEDLGEKLRNLYLDAKIITTVNDTRPVREAVESVYLAARKFEEASKVFNKLDQQEKNEAEAQKAALKPDKKSSKKKANAICHCGNECEGSSDECRSCVKKKMQDKKSPEEDDYGKILTPKEISQIVEKAKKTLDTMNSGDEILPLTSLDEEDLYVLVQDVVFDMLPAGTSLTSGSDVVRDIINGLRKEKKQWDTRSTGIEGQSRFGGLNMVASEKIATKLHPFTQTDWYGLAGAEEFSDGTSPFIGKALIDDEESIVEAQIVADANGIQIILAENPKSSVADSYDLNIYLDMSESRFGKDTILNEAEEIAAKPHTFQELEAKGFKVEDL